MVTPGKEKGQAIAELAILLPLLMLILLGCVDLGRAFSVWLTLANGTREGARYGSIYPADVAGITSRARADILADGPSDSRLRLWVSTPAGTGGGAPVVVSAEYSFPMLTSYLFGGQPLVIRASTQMAIIKGGA